MINSLHYSIFVWSFFKNYKINSIFFTIKVIIPKRACRHISITNQSAL
jgi:hypothetical protein